MKSEQKIRSSMIENALGYNKHLTNNYLLNKKETA